MFQQDISQALHHLRNNDPMDKDVDALENLQSQQDNDTQLDMQCKQHQIASLMNHHMY